MSGTVNTTITSANSSYALTIIGLYNSPQILQGFMADAMFETESVEMADLVLGADGLLSAGWVPQMTPQTISIMPNSPSSIVFETWVNAENAAQEKFTATATINIFSTGRQYVCINGFLRNQQAVPGARKILQGRPYVIVWNQITAGPIP